MTIVKRILCFANSKKMSGRCIAGREVVPTGAGAWIRPISARHDEEVSEYERQYVDGSDPRLLDIIDVPLIGPRPHACQTENWLLDPLQYWQLVQRASWHDIQVHVESPPTLWINGHHTYHGTNDEIPRNVADSLPGSLYLIAVQNVDLHVFAPSEAFGNPKRRVQARFQYRTEQYALWVTDPVVERAYLARADGYYQLEHTCLCISLGEPFRKSNGDEYRYKLVAGILQRNMVSNP